MTHWLDERCLLEHKDISTLARYRSYGKVNAVNLGTDSAGQGFDVEFGGNSHVAFLG
jgi:hypothetical protein